MSKKLLEYLAADSRGEFSRLIKGIKGEPRIAWYPSAGYDFRDLLYLHRNFATIRPPSKPEPEPPDFFIHSDYFPGNECRFLDSNKIYSDSRTQMVATKMEELPKIDLPLHPEIVDFPNKNRFTDRVVYFEIQVKSNKLGQYTCHLVYVFAENESFCAEVVLPNQGKFTHIVHVRYRSGGSAAGSWLISLLPSLGCELFITDGRHNERSGDRSVFKIYPNIREAGAECKLKIIESRSWSNHGDVSWYLVKPRALYSSQKLTPKQIDKALEKGKYLWTLYIYQKLTPEQIDKALEKGEYLWALYEHQKLTPENIDKALEIGEELDYLYEYQKLTPEQIYKALEKGLNLDYLYRYHKLDPFQIDMAIELERYYDELEEYQELDYEQKLRLEERKRRKEERKN